MGLFGRKPDADGLYRGDAPVSAPGTDGDAPVAYSSPDLVDNGRHIETGGAEWSTMPGPTAQGPPPNPPGSPPTATIATRPRAGRIVGVLVLLIVLAILLPVGFAVYRVLSAANSVTFDAQARASNDGLVGRHVGVTRLGEPVEIAFDDATFQVTVFGAVSQPGDAWGYASAGSDPILVVDAQISRTDAGTGPVDFLGWNWSVVGSRDERVSGDIITEYQPALDDARPVGGQTVRGFVTFATSTTSTSLTVAGEPFGVGLATWQINAVTPKAVAGEIGSPAQAEISRPGFAVTVGKPAVVAAGSKDLGAAPKSGQYLVLDVDFTPNEGTSGHLGIVDSKAFVFTPDGVPPLYSTFGAVPDAISLVSIDASEAESGVLAFDTAVATGTLELRDGAGRTVITWLIAGG